MLGVKTIGNATLLAFEDGPVLATDPWFDSYGAYFGSWTLSHPVPAAEQQEIINSKYIWISHGHPDHLDVRSMAHLKSNIILLPDHYGRRIYTDLKVDGFNVQIMPDREWVQLSPRIKAMCVCDYFQDAILLVDVGGRLFVNLNDAYDRAWGGLVREIAAGYKDRYLLKLSGYGDADMINFYDEMGNFIPPRAAQKSAVGAQIAPYMKMFKCNHFIPFSSFHRYQRTDSIWADAYTTPMDAYADQFDYRTGELLPAFVQIDAVSGAVQQIRPKEGSGVPDSPEKFGDNWSDMLDQKDVASIRQYFQRREHVWKTFGWLNFRVGGRDNRFDMDGPREVGFTFEVPRGSLMTSIEYEVFDDLLIGNFMRTTLHGGASLYPNFTPYVAKYADNGRAYTKSEIATYMADYRKRAPFEFLMHSVDLRSGGRYRKWLSPDSVSFRGAKKIYKIMSLGRP
jgi:L-ascorbate metabolism protein UlaG (beta-lactamase superfamily)